MTVFFRLRVIAAAVSLAALLVLTGCSSRPADQPPLGRVRGKVTMDGQPLPGVDIVFAPDKGRPSVATTDAAGRYDLSYINTTKGAKVGPHKVFIRPAEASLDEVSADGSKPAAPRPVVPAKYNKRSELTAEVKAGGNTIDFALDSK
jgi:hypothetical protein